MSQQHAGSDCQGERENCAANLSSRYTEASTIGVNSGPAGDVRSTSRAVPFQRVPSMQATLQNRMRSTLARSASAFRSQDWWGPKDKNGFLYRRYDVWVVLVRATGDVESGNGVAGLRPFVPLLGCCWSRQGGTHSRWLLTRRQAPLPGSMRGVLCICCTHVAVESAPRAVLPLRK